MNGVKIEKIAKELCEKSGCHHKCHDTKDCVVEDEALLLINENKSNNEIEEMAKVLCGMSAECGKCKLNGKCLAYNSADLIYNAGYRKQSEWISVKDKLPKENVRVLVWLKDDAQPFTHIDTDRLKDGHWVRWWKDVVYWMPLPEAPKMKGGAE